jgi:hypothetical protein
MAAKGKSSGGVKRGASKTATIKGAKGKAPVTFAKGGLHKSTGTPPGEPIPAAKMAAAKRGDLGPKAKKQAVMAAGLLAAGRKTAAANRAKGS